MTISNRTNPADISAPERRASKRLAADLLRFEKAFDQLERCRAGDNPPTAAPEAAPGKASAGQRSAQDYLRCLDEAIRQLAEEFLSDEAVAAALARHNGAADAPRETIRQPNAAFDASGRGGMITQVDTSAV